MDTPFVNDKPLILDRDLDLSCGNLNLCIAHLFSLFYLSVKLILDRDLDLSCGNLNLCIAHLFSLFYLSVKFY